MYICDIGQVIARVVSQRGVNRGYRVWFEIKMLVRIRAWLFGIVEQ